MIVFSSIFFSIFVSFLNNHKTHLFIKLFIQPAFFIDCSLELKPCLFLLLDHLFYHLKASIQGKSPNYIFNFMYY